MAGPATLRQGIERRRKVLKFVEKFTQKNGYAPSVEEIGTGVSLSKTAVRHHLAILKEDGHITMQPGKYRSLRVIPQEHRKVS